MLPPVFLNHECFNTQPPEGGWKLGSFRINTRSGFQHTAARRRLGLLNLIFFCIKTVSTHSRPKAAGFIHERHRSS